MNIINAVCVLLEQRICFWNDIKTQFTHLGINVDPFLCGDGGNDLLNYSQIDSTDLPPRYDNSITYPTWWARPNAYNCWKAHKSIIRNSLYKGHNHLLMLEDDVFVENDFNQIFTEASPYFDNHNWDMIYFGGFHNQTTTTTENQYVVRLNGSAGWHGVLMKDHVMEKLMAFPPIGPYDWIASTYIHPKFDCYAIYPSILSQRNNVYSYVEGSNLEKPDRWKL